MSMTFTKLFSSITASTIWAEPDHTRIVWITMLAMADQHGRVWASIPGLANMARVSIERCEEALEALKGPDKYSRTKDYEGRRVEEIDGGWRLLNHGKYRAIRDEDSIKESKRRYINARREAERAGVEQSRTKSKTVDRSRANTEAEAEAEAKEIQAPGVPGAVDGDADRPSLALVPNKTGVPDCPHQALIALYGKHLPHLRQPAVWDGQRAEAMRTRWRQCAQPSAFGDGYATEADGIAFWDRFFEFVSTCPKLRDGITSREGGQVRVWKPDLPWLLKAENFAKIIEGAYS